MVVASWRDDRIGIYRMDGMTNGEIIEILAMKIEKVELRRLGP